MATYMCETEMWTLPVLWAGGAPAWVLNLPQKKSNERKDYVIQQNIVIRRNRLNSPELAVSEPQVARQGVDRIAIQLPGLQNSAEVKKILGKTATLEFRKIGRAHV